MPVSRTVPSRGEARKSPPRLATDPFPWFPQCPRGQQEAIWAYRDAALTLSAWMTATGLGTDFTECDTAALNRFFRCYHGSHSQVQPAIEAKRRRGKMY
jgi:hypothetical protein